MNLLILGGSGFVSSRLVKKAVSCGHDVTCVTRGNRPPVEGAAYITADRTDATSLRNALAAYGRHFDAVLDCICFNGENARTDIAVLPEFTERIVVISTESVYHPAYKKVPQNENGEVYLTDGLYGSLKRQMEEVFINECPSSLKYTLFRPPHMFGAGSELGCFPEHTRQKNLIEYLRNSLPVKLVGNGHYLLQPLYVDDLTRIMLESICNEKTFNEIFCIAGPDVVTNKQYFDILGEILDINISYEEISEDGYLDVHPDCSVYLCDRVYDLSKLAATGIALPSTSLYDGLKEQVEYKLG